MSRLGACCVPPSMRERTALNNNCRLAVSSGNLLRIYGAARLTFFWPAPALCPAERYFGEVKQCRNFHAKRRSHQSALRLLLLNDTRPEFFLRAFFPVSGDAEPEGYSFHNCAEPEEWMEKLLVAFRLILLIVMERNTPRSFRWLRRAVEEVDKARASVATSLETENGFQAIFVAPEYMFAGENSGKRRSLCLSPRKTTWFAISTTSAKPIAIS
jgi:hypothetical protein